jgi:hypothetical protein
MTVHGQVVDPVGGSAHLMMDRRAFFVGGVAALAAPLAEKAQPDGSMRA